MNNLPRTNCWQISIFHQLIEDIAKEAFPKDVQFRDLDIDRDVKNLKNLMTNTVRGFPFESTQEIGMDVTFVTELTRFIHRYPVPIIKLTTNPDKVTVDVTNSNNVTIIFKL